MKRLHDQLMEIVRDVAFAIDPNCPWQSIVPTEWGAAFAEVVLMASRIVVPRAIEIGCAHGLSSALMALAGFDVWTWDVKRTDFAGPLWNALGVRDRIHHHIRTETPVSGPGGGGKYGLSFVDAVHEPDHVMADWTEVEPFLDDRAVVIFDDIDYRRGIMEFLVATFPGFKPMGRFGYAVLGAR